MSPVFDLCFPSSGCSKRLENSLTPATGAQHADTSDALALCRAQGPRHADHKLDGLFREPRTRRSAAMPRHVMSGCGLRLFPGATRRHPLAHRLALEGSPSLRNLQPKEEQGCRQPFAFPSLQSQMKRVIQEFCQPSPCSSRPLSSAHRKKRSRAIPRYLRLRLKDLSCSFWCLLLARREPGSSTLSLLFELLCELHSLLARVCSEVTRYSRCRCCVRLVLDLSRS